MSQLSHEQLENFVQEYMFGVADKSSPEMIAARLNISMGQFWYRLRKINYNLSHQCGCTLPPLNVKYQYPDYSEIADKFSLGAKKKKEQILEIEDDDFFSLDEE